MIEEVGLVKRVDDQYVWIETAVKNTCGSCHVQKNCGTSVVAKAFSPKPELLKLKSSIALQPGQSVKLGIPEQQLVSASALMYLLPIFVLMLSAVSFSSIFTGLPEWIVIVMSFVAMFISFCWVARIAKKADKGQFSPIILGAVNASVMTFKNEIPVHKQ